MKKLAAANNLALASSYARQRSWEEAEALYRSALEAQQEVRWGQGNKGEGARRRGGDAEFCLGGMATSERLDTATFDLSSCLHNSHSVDSGGLLHTQAPTFCLQPTHLPATQPPYLLAARFRQRTTLPACAQQSSLRAYSSAKPRLTAAS